MCFKVPRMRFSPQRAILFQPIEIQHICPIFSVPISIFVNWLQHSANKTKVAIQNSKSPISFHRETFLHENILYSQTSLKSTYFLFLVPQSLIQPLTFFHLDLAQYQGSTSPIMSPPPLSPTPRPPPTIHSDHCCQLAFRNAQLITLSYQFGTL